MSSDCVGDPWRDSINEATNELSSPSCSPLSPPPSLHALCGRRVASDDGPRLFAVFFLADGTCDNATACVDIEPLEDFKEDFEIEVTAGDLASGAGELAAGRCPLFEGAAALLLLL